MGRRKYRKGERVRYVGNTDSNFTHGRTYEVREGQDSSDDVMLWVADKSDWWFVHEQYLEAVSEAPKAPMGIPTIKGESTPTIAQQANALWHSSATPAFSFVNQEINKESTMATPKQTRNLVRVALIDEDAGLDVKFSLVKDFGTFVLEGSQEELIREILMDSDVNVSSALRAHNAVRGKQVDLDIRQRTGNEVKLQEVKLKDLTWKVTNA